MTLSEIAVINPQDAETVASGKIPDGFWNAKVFENNPALSEIHAMVVSRLIEESPDADTLELMMMERVCFLYIFMRASEFSVDEDKRLAFDRNYKDMMSLWVSMAGDLRKQRLRAEETMSIRYQIVSEVSKALKVALKNVDPSVAKEVQSKLVTLVAV